MKNSSLNSLCGKMTLLLSLTSLVPGAQADFLEDAKKAAKKAIRANKKPTRKTTKKIVRKTAKKVVKKTAARIAKKMRSKKQR